VDVALLTVGYKKVIAMNGIKFEFNDIGNIILYEKVLWAETVCQSRIFYTTYINYYIIFSKKKIYVTIK